MSKCVQNMRAKYYEFRVYVLQMHFIKVGAFAWYSVKIRVIFRVRFQKKKSL